MEVPLYRWMVDFMENTIYSAVKMDDLGVPP